MALQVYRWSDGTYLECQDFWRISGIERDVYLYVEPNIRVTDLWAKTPLDESFKNGLFEVEIDIRNDKTVEEKISVHTELFKPNGRRVYNKTDRVMIPGDAQIKHIFKKQILDVDAWTAETPHLYTVQVTLKKGYSVITSLSDEIGFRTIEVTNGQLLVLSLIHI